MKMEIKDVWARRDVVDTMCLRVRLDLRELRSDEGMLMDWFGEVSFRALSYTSNRRLMPHRDALWVNARWKRQQIGFQVSVIKGRELTLDFDIQLPGDGLERIEALYEDGLGMTIDGRFACRHESSWWEESASSSRFDLPRERWDQEIRAVLRSSEGAAPPSAADGGAFTITIPSALAGARSAFDRGEFKVCMDECLSVARSIYRTMSERQPDARVTLQAKFVSQLESRDADEALARHTLVSTASLASLLGW